MKYSSREISSLRRANLSTRQLAATYVSRQTVEFLKSRQLVLHGGIYYIYQDIVDESQRATSQQLTQIG